MNQDDEEYQEFGVVWGQHTLCDECSVMINELGQYQCRDCLCLHSRKSTKQSLIQEYSDFGKETQQFVKLSLARLGMIKRLYARGSFSKLKRIYYVYKDEDGKTINNRGYYELKN